MLKSDLPTLDPLDKRLHAFRDDLADIALKGKLSSRSFATPDPTSIRVPVANLKMRPQNTDNTIHQLLMGERVNVFEQSGEWAWVQSQRDNYVGYVKSTEICEAGSAAPPTHIVRAVRTFVYPKAELRNPPIAVLSIGCQVPVTGYQIVRGTQYALLESGGAIVKSHLRDLGSHAQDFVAQAEQLLHTPYLWGGSSGFGLDCSSLVQLSMRMCGREELRDSDMQAATIGEEIDAGDNMQYLKRGDLIFWPGHVAIYKGTIHKVPHIIHASGHTMSVAVEPLHPAIERIAYLYQMPIGFRRP